jgi:hypothetical protein
MKYNKNPNNQYTAVRRYPPKNWIPTCNLIHLYHMPTKWAIPFM